jgi:hypothetical protein
MLQYWIRNYSKPVLFGRRHLNYARFAAPDLVLEISEQIEGLELPQRLIEILAKDHRRKQEHKDLIELDV